MATISCTALGDDCASDYANFGYVTPDDLLAVKAACASGQTGRLNTSVAEIALYLAYECHGKPTANQFRNNLYASLGKQRYDESARGAPQWERIAPLKLKFTGVPAEDVARWKEEALYDLQSSRKKLEESGYTQNNVRNFILDLKLAQPFLPEEEIQEGLRLAASKIARQYANSYAGLFEPKLFQFYKESIRRDLGLKYRPLSDIWVYRDRSQVNLWLVSTDPVESTTGTPTLSEGLRWLQAGSTEVPADAQKGARIHSQETKWKHAGREYKAEIGVVAGDEPKNFVRAVPALDYDQMWHDGKLNGIIFPGTNMGVGEAGAHEVMNEYRAFYEDQGFRFGRPKKIADFEQHLKEELSSGRLDFLLKEAHSEGSDASLVKFTREGELITGKKKTGKKEESVQIFFPSEKALEERPGESLAFDSIADWMKARSAADGKQLLVVDTSCGGIGPVCRLANTVQDPNLVVVGSANTLDTFSNDPASPLYHVLEGIRKKKNFAEMDAAMKAANTENEGVYHFPGSPEWSRAISAEASRSSVVDTKIFENGVAVDVETMGR